ncbi:hypothetical protein T11_4494 [Trichinella zimbabwensis]|uniref:Uncharacterized protein n=1 Tax=Trichinella zimbabwensis TaxID=268475 RepID=A0A0V1H8H2_9BILA|nr:hypothetical protein T11_4494 [Trichinella zimbabwensis]
MFYNKPDLLILFLTVDRVLLVVVNGQCTDKTLDFRLTLEYDRTPEQSVVEWLEKLEVVRQLRRIDDVMSIIPLRLAAAPSQYTCSYRLRRGRVCERKLSANEPLDVFLADLQRLVDLFSGVSEKAMSCAFIAGMPENVQKMLRAGSPRGYDGHLPGRKKSRTMTAGSTLWTSMLRVRWAESFCQELAVLASGPDTGRWSSSRNIPPCAQRPPLPAVFNGGGTNRSYGCKRRATKRPSGHRMLVMRRPRFMMQKLEEQRRRYNYDERWPEATESKSK